MQRGLLTVAFLLLGLAGGPAAVASERRVEFGMVSDVHYGVISNASARLDAFLDAMRASPPDFIVQLGDFCTPAAASASFLAKWNAYSGPRHHVIGNHDTDGGYTQAQVAAYYGMPDRYYTFDQGWLRGIVLDGNEAGGSASGYRRYIGAAQQAWLAQQLAATDRPVIVFLHQPLDSPETIGIENGSAVLEILRQAEAARPGTVIAVLSGHLHQDYDVVTNGIHCIQMNSASYFWYTGVVPYSGPLWARVSVDLDTRLLRVQGMASAWEGTDPWQQGATDANCPTNRVRPAVSDREFALSEAAVTLAESAISGISPAAAAEYVIHVTVDGLRSDALTTLGPTNLPNFYRIRAEGAYTDNARTDPDVTVTMPDHVCMITGRAQQGTNGHHITRNSDPGSGTTPGSVSITTQATEFVRGTGALRIDDGSAANYVAVTSSVIRAPAGSNTITVMTWYKFADVGGNGSDVRNFLWETGPTNYSLSFGVRSDAADAQKHVQWYTEAPATGAIATNLPAIGDGQWHHAAVTCDDRTHSVAFYHDGVLADQATIPGLVLARAGATQFNIGSHRTGDGSRNWDGFIDDMAVLDTAIGSNEVAAIYAGTTNVAAVAGTNLVAYWTFDTDYSSATNNALYEGAPQTGYPTVHSDCAAAGGVPYVSSIFDLVHDHGLRTAFHAGWNGFNYLDYSWSPGQGAADAFGDDNGTDKIDAYVLVTDDDLAAQTTAFMDQMATAPNHYSLLHWHKTDSAGHSSGWMSTAYLEAVKLADAQLGRLMTFVETNSLLAGKTTVILTSDHGGSGYSHGTPTLAVEYTIPFYVWGAGVAHGRELYSLNPTSRLDPGTGRPDSAAVPQPIRNGDTANLAATLLGLGPVTGSTINAAQDLNVLTVSSSVTNGTSVVSTNGLLVYYDFEETGTAGLANKAPGATQYNATRYGGGTFTNGTNPSGPGFRGNVSFDGGDGLSDRSALLVGNVLNLVDARGDAVVAPLGTSALGQTFTVSVWHNLTPGAANGSGRFFVFEASTNPDVSWGTSSGDTYVAYVAGVASGSKVLSRNGWHHTVHVFTVAGTNTVINFYVDGAWAGSGSAPTANMDFSAIHFGRYRTGIEDREWDGMLDEISLWTRALSASEVATLYNLGRAGVPLTSGALTKADNLDALELASSWLPGDAAAGATNVAIFDGTFSLAGELPVGAPVDWAGVMVGSGTNAIRITNSVPENFIRLGAFGVDLSGAGRDLSIENVRIGAAQTWNVGTGRVFSAGSASLLEGGWALAKTGAGAVSLAGANTYTGGTTISAGSIRLGGDSALGGGVVTIAGGAISSDGSAARALINPITLGGAGTLGDAALDGALALSGPIELGGAQRTLTVLSLVGVAGAIGNGALRKSGAGTLVLGGANTYRGATAINGGTLAVAPGGNLGGGEGMEVVVADGATLSLLTAGAGLHTGSVIRIGASGTVDLAGTVNQPVKSLYIGGALMPAGTWGGPGSAAAHKDARFSGAGSLTVMESRPQTNDVFNTGGLLAYFDFEEAGTNGLLNKAPNATQYHATRYGGGAFNSSDNPSGPGFAGNASFDGGDGLSNRGTLLAGNALNLVDARADAVVVPLGTAQMGNEFTISVWHDLTPGANNASARFFVFEASTNWDVSWGISSNNTYVPYVGQIAGGSAVLPRNAWQHTAHVFATNGADTVLTTYVNGNPVSTQSAPTASMDFSAIYFGRARVGTDLPADRDWDGMMDEITLWNRALSAGEVGTLNSLGRLGLPLGQAGVVKANNLDSMDLVSSWLPGDTTPGASSIALFDSTFSQTGELAIAASVAYGGIKVTSGTSSIRITNDVPEHLVQVGAYGVDMSAAERDLAIRNLRLSASQAWTVGSGRTLAVEGPSAAYSVTKAGAGALEVGASGFGLDSLTVLGGSVSGAGTLTAASASVGVLVSNLTGIVTVSAGLANPAGGHSLRKEGAGTLVLSGRNTYTGATVISGGELWVSNIADSVESNIGIVTTTSSRLSLVGGTMVYTGTGSQSTARYLWADTGSAGAIDVTSPTGSLTLAPAGGTRTMPFTKRGAGTLTLNGAWSGGGSVTINGGTLVLGAANTYTGATVVSSGTLQVRGSTAAGSAVSVGAGGMLSGTGTVYGAVASAGTVAPGASPGTLTVGAYTQSESGTLRIEVGGAGADCDQLRVLDRAALSGRLDVALVDGFVPDRSFDAVILEAAGGVTGRFSVVVGDAGPGGEWAVEYRPSEVRLHVVTGAIWKVR